MLLGRGRKLRRLHNSYLSEFVGGVSGTLTGRRRGKFGSQFHLSLGCTNYGPWSPAGSATWTISPVGTPGLYQGDYAMAAFYGEDSGPGTYQITYNWNNQGSGSHHCSGSQSQTITVTNPWNSGWNSPGNLQFHLSLSFSDFVFLPRASREAAAARQDCSRRFLISALSAPASI